jgi:hypothetical protein
LRREHEQNKMVALVDQVPEQPSLAATTTMSGNTDVMKVGVSPKSMYSKMLTAPSPAIKAGDGRGAYNTDGNRAVSFAPTTGDRPLGGRTGERPPPCDTCSQHARFVVRHFPPCYLSGKEPPPDNYYPNDGRGPASDAIRDKFNITRLGGPPAPSHVGATRFTPGSLMTRTGTTMLLVGAMMGG